MKRRLAILTEIISPYRIPLFNALARQEKVDLQVIFLAETDPQLRQWQVYREEINFPYVILPSWRKRAGGYNLLLNRGVGAALAAAAPDTILCGGYNYLAFWQALAWARSRHIPFFLWSESNLQDQRPGHAPVEMLKQEFFRRCSGFVVPGKSAAGYLRAHRIKDDLIFTAPNAVDNDFFAADAAVIRQHADVQRRQLNLPNRYFLFTGRLVVEKGVLDLLAAYAKLDAAVRRQVALVFVGDGAVRGQLERQAAMISPGVIKFSGFAQREQLAAYYALAEMFILPTHTDPWGLVVNEAMACGLPVIVSSVAGCASDLVRENWNGLLIPPKDVLSLTLAMQRLASDPYLPAAMGANSAAHIAGYSPQEWSQGILRMVNGAA
jgi:glycosyltransferase involved in cell wall biosynthesis